MSVCGRKGVLVGWVDAWVHQFKLDAPLRECNFSRDTVLNFLTHVCVP